MILIMKTTAMKEKKIVHEHRLVPVGYDRWCCNSSNKRVSRAMAQAASRASHRGGPGSVPG